MRMTAILLAIGLVALCPDTAGAQETSPAEATTDDARWVYLGGDDFISAYVFRGTRQTGEHRRLVLLTSYYSRPLDDAGTIYASDILYTVDCERSLISPDVHRFYDRDGALLSFSRPAEGDTSLENTGEDWSRMYAFYCGDAQYDLVVDPRAHAAARFAAQ
jgi:hypothetical protein